MYLTYNDLLEVIEQFKELTKSKDFTVIKYETIYSSTALGYPGIGCDALTKGDMMVVYNRKYAFVFPGQYRLGYTISNITQKFWDDLRDYKILHTCEPELIKMYGTINKIHGLPNYQVIFKSGTERYSSNMIPGVFATEKQLNEIFSNITNVDEFISICKKIKMSICDTENRESFVKLSDEKTFIEIPEIQILKL